MAELNKSKSKAGSKEKKKKERSKSKGKKDGAEPKEKKKKGKSKEKKKWFINLTKLKSLWITINLSSEKNHSIKNTQKTKFLFKRTTQKSW